MEQIYLSRRNLLTLISKLDRKRLGQDSKCTIVKNDNAHPTMSQSMDSCSITAVEDEDYYIDRQPWRMHPADVRD